MQMLRATLPDTTQREQFAQLYVQYTGNPDGLWPDGHAAVRCRRRRAAAVHGPAVLPHHQQRAPRDRPARGREGQPPQSAADLAALGYYDAAKWAPLIGTAIPPSIPGGTAAEQAANYAELLAAQVRVSFPTLTLAGKVPAGVIPVTGNADIASRVAGFLTANQASVRHRRRAGAGVPGPHRDCRPRPPTCSPRSAGCSGSAS